MGLDLREDSTRFPIFLAPPGGSARELDSSLCSSTFHVKKIKTKTMTTLHLRQSIGRSPLRLGFLLIPLTLGCFALSPLARAVDPVRDGGPPKFRTAQRW